MISLKYIFLAEPDLWVGEVPIITKQCSRSMQEFWLLMPNSNRQREIRSSQSKVLDWILTLEGHCSLQKIGIFTFNGKIWGKENCKQYISFMPVQKLSTRSLLGVLQVSLKNWIWDATILLLILALQIFKLLEAAFNRMNYLRFDRTTRSKLVGFELCFITLQGSSFASSYTPCV